MSRSRLAEIADSFLALPTWVQVWVGGILVPGNAIAFSQLASWSGRAAAAAAVLVVATNLPILWRERGMSRLMAVPHLLIWGPLEVLLALRLQGVVGSTAVDATERNFVLMLLAINGISLAFDARDAWRWLQGDRAVPRRAAVR